MENSRLYLGDCINIMDNLINEGIKIDLTVTSPPYDDLRDYDNSLVWNFNIFKQVADRLYKITKDGGIVVWVVGDKTKNGSETLNSFKQAIYFNEIGFRVHDTMIYKKHNPTPNAGKRYQQCFEYMFVLSKGKPKVTNILTRERRNECNDKRTHRIKKTNRKADGKFTEAKLYIVKDFVPRDNIWTYKVGLYNSTMDKEAFEHPAIFPEALANDHILSWSNEGDIVFDLFMGSGTTGKMALLNNRQFIGIEKVEKYYNLATKRMEKLSKK